MSKKVLVEGRPVIVPDDATPDEIDQIAGGGQTSQAPNAGLSAGSAMPAPPSVGYQDFISKTLLKAGNTLGGMAQHPLDTLMNAPGPQMAVKGAIQNYQDFRNFQRGKSPSGDEQVNRVAGQLGVDAPAVREAASNRDYGQLFAETAVPVGMALIGSKLGRKVLPDEMTPQTQTAQDNLVKVLDPNKSMDASILKSVKAGTAGLQDVARTSSPQTVDSLSKAITAKQAEMEGTFQQVKAPVAHTLVSTTPIGKAMLKEITPGMEIDKPQLAEAIRKEANRYIGNTASVDDLDSLRNTVNNDLSTQYKKDGLSLSDAKKAPQYAYQFAKADAARDLLYDTIKSKTGQDLTPLKMMQSHLRTIQGQLETVNDANTISDMQNRATPLGERVGGVLQQLGNFKPGNAGKVAISKYLSSSGSSNAAVRRFTGAMNTDTPQLARPVVGSLANSMLQDDQ